MRSRQKFNITLVEFLLVVPVITYDLLYSMTFLSEKDKNAVLGKYGSVPQLFPFLQLILKDTFHNTENYYMQHLLSYQEFATILLLPESTSTALEVRIQPLFAFIYKNMIVDRLAATEENILIYNKFKEETIKILQSYVNLSLSFKDILSTVSLQKED